MGSLADIINKFVKPVMKILLVEVHHMKIKSHATYHALISDLGVAALARGYIGLPKVCHVIHCEGFKAVHRFNGLSGLGHCIAPGRPSYPSTTSRWILCSSLTERNS